MATPFGVRMAGEEDSRFFAGMSGSTERVDRLDSVIQSALSAFLEAGNRPVLFVRGLAVLRALNASRTFKAWWSQGTVRPGIAGFYGWYDGSVVVQNQGMAENAVAIVDPNRYARLGQYRFDDSHDSLLRVEVQAIDEATATDMVASQRTCESLTTSSNPPVHSATDVRELSQQVLVTVSQKLDFDILQQWAGRIIQFIEPDGSGDDPA